MKRRSVLHMLGAAALLPLSVGGAIAQQKRILMVLWRGVTPAEEAFQARLRELGIAADYKIVDAAQDRGKLATQLRDYEADFEGRKFDAIYAHGTTSVQVAKGLIKDRIPLVFSVVFDPEGAKLVNSNKAPGGNITGVTNGVSIADQFNAFVKLKPFKTLGVLFDARATNANLIEADVREWAQQNGVTYVARRVAPNTALIDEVLGEIISDKLAIESLYAGADSYLSTLAKKINDAIGDKVRLFGGTQTFVDNGWLAAFTPVYTELGVVAAESMAKVFAGTPAGTLPVILPTPKLYISKAAAEKHGVLPPSGAEILS